MNQEEGIKKIEPTETAAVRPEAPPPKRRFRWPWKKRELTPIEETLRRVREEHRQERLSLTLAVKGFGSWLRYGGWWLVRQLLGRPISAILDSKYAYIVSSIVLFSAVIAAVRQYKDELTKVPYGVWAANLMKSPPGWLIGAAVASLLVKAGVDWMRDVRAAISPQAPPSDAAVFIAQSNRKVVAKVSRNVSRRHVADEIAGSIADVFREITGAKEKPTVFISEVGETEGRIHPTDILGCSPDRGIACNTYSRDMLFHPFNPATLCLGPHRVTYDGKCQAKTLVIEDRFFEAFYGFARTKVHRESSPKKGCEISYPVLSMPANDEEALKSRADSMVSLVVTVYANEPCRFRAKHAELYNGYLSVLTSSLLVYSPTHGTSKDEEPETAKTP